MREPTKRKSMSAQEAMDATKVRYAETIECLDDHMTDAEYNATQQLKWANEDEAERKAVAENLLEVAK